MFIDLSNAGQNASVTDSLGVPTATTTVNVGYLTKGANGVAINATAPISVGAGTNYANTAQGLISAINNSGLGVTATFGTAAQAGSAAVASAVAANATNSALKTGATDTGIIISGAGVGVNNNSAATGYTNGVGEVGTLTVSNVGDQLGGVLNIVGANGLTHSITLGTGNATDTLANLESTINSGGYGVTASLNTTGSVTNASGTHATNTVLTLTSANSGVSVSGTNITDAELSQPTVAFTLTNGGVGAGIGTTMASISVANASDTLTGEFLFTPDTVAHAAIAYNLDGQTLAQVAATINGNNVVTTGTYANINATLSNNNTTLTLTQNVAKVNGFPAIAADALGTNVITDNNATTGVSIVAASAVLAVGSAGTLGTINVTNANDALTGGSITIAGTKTGGTVKTYTLGTANSTDNLANLMATINADTGTSGVTAAWTSTAQTGLTLSAAAAGTLQGAVWGAATASTFSLTGVPTTNNAPNATVLGTLSLPAAGSASGDTLGGTLILGTETILLGTATGNQKTNTMTNLAQTINAGNYGVNALLNAAGTAITFTSPDSVNAPAATLVWAPGGTFKDVTDGNAVLLTNTANNELQSSAYYSVGISGTIADTSTSGGTAVVGLSNDLNGSGGTATISYSDSAGQSLSATDLSNQADAEATLTMLNTAISDVSAQDGYLGAQINTLNAASSVLSTQQENITSAQNAVQATDYATATSNMSKYEILSQTGIRPWPRPTACSRK